MSHGPSPGSVRSSPSGVLFLGDPPPAPPPSHDPDGAVREEDPDPSAEGSKGTRFLRRKPMVRFSLVEMTMPFTILLRTLGTGEHAKVPISSRGKRPGRADGRKLGTKKFATPAVAASSRMRSTVSQSTGGRARNLDGGMTGNVSVTARIAPAAKPHGADGGTITSICTPCAAEGQGSSRTPFASISMGAASTGHQARRSMIGSITHRNEYSVKKLPACTKKMSMPPSVSSAGLSPGGGRRSRGGMPAPARRRRRRMRQRCICARERPAKPRAPQPSASAP
mmetsp:Transcript_30562/g.95001  ORF Transcript_30562/g.95001 Transcript_30562/m.95001 type:complete len:281 (+) Transcript_30562:247-1089(+)